MELIVVFAGFLVVIVILLFLSALHYFLVRTTDPSSSDAVNTLTQRTTSQRARKRARRQTKRSQQQQQQPKHDEQTNGQDDQSLDNKTDDDDDESVSPPVEQPHEETSADNDDEFEDIIDLEPSSPSMSSEFSNVTRVIDEETPPTALKQRAKQKPSQTNGKQSSNVLKNESIVPLKPQASVAPVKQVERSKSKDSSKPSTNADPADALKSKSNSSSTVYSPSQQRIRSEDPTNSSKTSSSKKKSKKTPIQPESSSSPTIQHDQTNSRSGQRMNKDTPSQSSELPESSMNNDYSSESDFVTEPVAPTKYSTNHHSYPSKTFDRLSHHSKLVESHSSPCHPVDRLVSALDADTFTTDQLELLLSKVISKHCFHPTDRQDLLTTRKNEIMLERLIDENNRNHVKMLAMELQSEKNRVSDLSQTNAELEQRLRELQHYSQQQYVPPESLLRYQQAINSYQLQLKRITDENNQLMHQLHAYSMIPASINELKQQNQIVEEQIRQMSLRNSILEKEIADGERASKNAADIYRKSDGQKQERIEQMVADLAKYKKIDKDIATTRQKTEDLEKSFQAKYDRIRQECDELRERHEQLKEKREKYEELKWSYQKLKEKCDTEEVADDQSSLSLAQLEDDLTEARKKHEQLKQRNCKIMEQLNKLTQEQKSTTEAVESS